MRFGAGYFPRKAVFCHGGLLYLTTARVVFRSHRLDQALSADDGTLDLPLSQIAAVGSTPRWRPVMGRRFLRLDSGERSYLFLFSVRHPRWRTRFQSELLKAAPGTISEDGWGSFD